MAADTKHIAFRQPDEWATKVWRYMDFTKYVALLESSALYFARVDKLDDPFEGTTTVASNEAARKGGEEFMAQLADLRKMARETSFVSCWHMGDHESAAMWRLYSKTDEAIAIQTSYQKLVDALPETSMIGMVEYIDYDSALIPMKNVLWPLMHKRLSFVHEQEVRAVIAFDMEGHNYDGKHAEVDLDGLVERVFVSPSSPEWYCELVVALTQRLGYRFPIKKSRLSENPIR